MHRLYLGNMFGYLKYQNKELINLDYFDFKNDYEMNDVIKVVIHICNNLLEKIDYQMYNYTYNCQKQIKIKMEIKDILSELITVSTNLLNERGEPDNFDLEDFISTLEDYYEELDEIGHFYFLDDEDEGYDFGDEDDY